MSAKLLAFCFRSLYRQYGAAFLLRVVSAHPVATLRGIAQYAGGRSATAGPWMGGPASLVGLGFCVKPLNPACPSGRANHTCMFLESACGEDFAPCRDCLIRAVGRQALLCGSAFYVMTSAQDILHDVLRPALELGRFRSALLTVCRYSFEPIRLAMAVCGVETRLVPFVHGDCRDYSTWLQADVGQKAERTALDEVSFRELIGTLSSAAQSTPSRRFRRDGNIYMPF